MLTPTGSTKILVLRANAIRKLGRPANTDIDFYGAILRRKFVIILLALFGQASVICFTNRQHLFTRLRSVDGVGPVASDNR